MRFVTRSEVRSRLEGRTVAIVGSGPGCVDNPAGFIDGRDVVVRVNNYRLMGGTGQRTDIFYSFFGNSIRKSAEELVRDGVTLCWCKCPDGKPIESEWHRRHGKMAGVDFRWIYQRRAAWWFCDTFVPSVGEFRAMFDLIGGHIPTTGFAAILEVLSCAPRAVHLTGFDFFRSGKHNVTDTWRQKNDDDPIGHVPERELVWLAANAARFPVTFDAALTRALSEVKA